MAIANVTSVCADSQPWSGASMMPYTSALRPAIDSSAPSGSSGAWIFSRDRDQEEAGDQRDHDDEHVDEEDRAPPEVLEQQAADDAADRDADPGETGPDRDRPRPLVRREHVRQDRQRRRHHERGADAHDRAGADDRRRRARERREHDATPNTIRPPFSARRRP